MQMAEGLDTGGMLLTYETPIGARETAGELFDRLAQAGAALLIETLERLDLSLIHIWRSRCRARCRCIRSVRTR